MRDRTVNAQGFNRVTRPAMPVVYDIGSMTIGSVLEVATDTGSRYWITRVAGTYRNTTLVYGVSVTTDSHSSGRSYLPPRECYIQRFIRHGGTISMSGTGVKETSSVVSWRML